jgi:alpha-N-arabinofuranosidase
MTFQKMSDKCSIANWAQLINCIGTIQTDPDGLILTPVYLALKLFANHMYQNLIEDVRFNCNTFESPKFGRIPKRENVPYIECNATINNDGNGLSIAIINKHFTDNIEIELNIDGFRPKEQGKLMELNSNSPFDYNTIENRNKIKIVEKQINFKSNMILNLSAHSLIILKLSKK